MSNQMSPLENARAAWGDPLPDWIEALAVECGLTSQARVAAALGRSGAMVSQVLRKKYLGNLAAVEERFRGVFLDSRLNCPALGDIPSNICQDWREKSRDFTPTNSQRALMYRACARCPRNQKAAEE
jgi:hypothetical protein